ncbi:MAG: CoA-binding protein [Sandaracinaceae bacterium]|nr:CoA-binding protein [Sandaracinaceae bacterium]
MSDDALDSFFAPRSVAVVGASAEADKVGHALFKNLLFGAMNGTRREDGFPGPVHAVNKRGGQILGQKVHCALADVGEPIDLVVVAVPPRFVKGVVEEAGAIGAKAVIVISAGFGEMGAEGKALEEEVARAARARGMRLIGPNCLGVIRPSRRLNASFAVDAPPGGGIGLLSQSGALVTGLISYAQREKFGLSAAISLGAKSDVDDQEMLRWLANDPETKAIALYVEAIHDPGGFPRGGARGRGEEADRRHQGRHHGGRREGRVEPHGQPGRGGGRLLRRVRAGGRAAGELARRLRHVVARARDAACRDGQPRGHPHERGRAGRAGGGRLRQARARARRALERDARGARRGAAGRVVAQQPGRRDRRRHAGALPRRAAHPRPRAGGGRHRPHHDGAGHDGAAQDGGGHRGGAGGPFVEQAAPGQLHRPHRHRGGQLPRRARHPRVQHAGDGGERDGRAGAPRRVAAARGRGAGPAAPAPGARPRARRRPRRRRLRARRDEHGPGARARDPRERGGSATTARARRRTRTRRQRWRAAWGTRSS